jgi:ElaB/YqjD/DUF883 family membrane-anchored ribosome-binding protein
MDIEVLIEKIKNSLKKGADKVSDEIDKSQVFDKYKDSDDKVADILDDAGKALTDVVDKVSEKTEPAIKKTKAKIYERIYEEYKKAGYPYGDTHEGFLQWTDERETAIREKVDDGLEISRNTILKGVEKTKDFFNSELAKHQKPSDAVVDDIPINEQKTDDKK